MGQGSEQWGTSHCPNAPALAPHCPLQRRLYLSAQRAGRPGESGRLSRHSCAVLAPWQHFVSDQTARWSFLPAADAHSQALRCSIAQSCRNSEADVLGLQQAQQQCGSMIEALSCRKAHWGDRELQCMSAAQEDQVTTVVSGSPQPAESQPARLLRALQELAAKSKRPETPDSPSGELRGRLMSFCQDR